MKICTTQTQILNKGSLQFDALEGVSHSYKPDDIPRQQYRTYMLPIKLSAALGLTRIAAYECSQLQKTQGEQDTILSPLETACKTIQAQPAMNALTSYLNETNNNRYTSIWTFFKLPINLY